MVNSILAATVCLGALLSLYTVAGCCGGGHRGGCHGGGGFRFGGGCGGGRRPPCHGGFHFGGGGRPCHGGGRPPCHGGGRPPCSGGFHFGGGAGFLFGQRPAPAPRPPPPPPPPRPCPFGNLINGVGNALHGLFGGGCHFRPPHFQSHPHRPPPIVGNQGPFSWTTTYINNVRYVVFTYKYQVNGRWETKTLRYSFPTGDLNAILRLLVTFKTQINWNPAPVVTHINIEGSLGGFSWKTTWTGGRGKITFYYRTIVNGRIVVSKSKTYTITSQDQNTIDRLLLQFQSSFGYTGEQDSGTGDGDHYTFNSDFSDGQGKVTFTYKYYVNGHLRTSVSKEYTFTSSSNVNGQIAAFYKQFQEYCQIKRQEADNANVVKPVVTGKITWKTEQRGSDTYFLGTYNQYTDGELVDSKSKDYLMSGDSEAEVNAKLDQFKSDLKNGRV